MVLSLGEAPVKRISTKYLILQKRTLRYILQTDKIVSFLIRKCLCTAIKFLVLWIRLKLNARQRRKKRTDKYFKLVFKDIKFTLLFYTLINFTKFLHKKIYSWCSKECVFSCWRKDVEWDAKFSLKNISRKTFRKKL